MTRIELSHKPSGHWFIVCMLILGGLLLNGCHTGPPSARPLIISTTNAPTAEALAGKLRVGDSLTITYSDIPTPLHPFEGKIKEDGTITVHPFSQSFEVAGKTTRALEMEIRERYVPKYFVNLTVNVQSQNLFYSVDGEVKNSNRQVYLTQMTLLGAIASAQGFTDFADKKKVKVIRADGKILIVNCVKAINRPELDVPIFPGDKIIVPRRFL